MKGKKEGILHSRGKVQRSSKTLKGREERNLDIRGKKV